MSRRARTSSLPGAAGVTAHELGIGLLELLELGAADEHPGVGLVPHPRGWLIVALDETGHGYPVGNGSTLARALELAVERLEELAAITPAKEPGER